VVDVGEPEPAALEAPRDRRLGKPRPVLLAEEPLLLDCAYDFAVDDEAGRGIGVVRVDAEDRRHAAPR